MRRFGMCFQQMQYVLVTNAIQFVVFNHLYIAKAFLLPEETLKQYDRMIFF